MTNGVSLKMSAQKKINKITDPIVMAFSVPACVTANNKYIYIKRSSQMEHLKLCHGKSLYHVPPAILKPQVLYGI